MMHMNIRKNYFSYRGETIITKEQSLFVEPRFNTFGLSAASIAAISASVGVAGLGMSVASAAGAFSPSSPDLNASSRKMAQLQAEMLPSVRGMQAQAELGGKMLKYGYTDFGDSNEYIAKIQKQIDALSKSNDMYAPLQIEALKKQLVGVQPDSRVYKDSKGKIVGESQAIADFTGIGEADIQGKIMTDLAKGQLETSKKYDPQFIAAALEQEKQADPQKFAAREALYSKIQEQIKNPPQSPVAEQLNRQVQEKVAAGSALTPEEQSMLDTAVAQATSARGDYSAPADYSKALTTGFAGSQRQRENVGAGMNWLASGETPDDIAYRAEQQNLKNLADYYSGKTPQSQFSSLSSAGSTPIAQSSALPSYNMGAGQQGSQAALTGYEASMNQPNPWMAGMSGALNLASAGIKGFGSGQTVAKSTSTGGI